MMVPPVNDTVEMAVMGLETSVVAPLLVIVSRSWRGWRWLSWPAPVAVATFLVAHVVLTAWMLATMPGWLADLGFQVGLVAISAVFWLPVVGPRPISDAARMIYLFLAMPTMDLAGVYVVLRGDAAGGLAMIVAMLPVGLVAVAMAWRWIVDEGLSAPATASGARR
jgi:hypothetical protein